MEYGLTEGQWIKQVLPESTIVRAFSHIQDELLVSRAQKNPGIWAAAYATDAIGARPQIEQLIGATGYAPVFVGTLAQSAMLDPGGAAFLRLLTKAEAQDLAVAHRLPELMARFNTATLGEVLHENVRWTFPYGPTLGLPEVFEGRENVLKHLSGVRLSGVRISAIRTERETTHGAIVHATATFPGASGLLASQIVSVITIRDALISEVREYWDTAAVRRPS